MESTFFKCDCHWSTYSSQSHTHRIRFRQRKKTFNATGGGGVSFVDVGGQLQNSRYVTCARPPTTTLTASVPSLHRCETETRRKKELLDWIVDPERCRSMTASHKRSFSSLVKRGNQLHSNNFPRSRLRFYVMCYLHGLSPWRRSAADFTALQSPRFKAKRKPTINSTCSNWTNWNECNTWPPAPSSATSEKLHYKEHRKTSLQLFPKLLRLPYIREQDNE